MADARLERLHTLAPGLMTRVSKTLTEADAALFLAISGDMHPLYQHAPVAEQSEYGGRILPASLLLGMLSAAMAETSARVPAPGAVSYRYSLEMLAPVRSGDTVTAELTVAELRPERYEAYLDAVVTNQRGERVMAGRNVMKII